MDKDIEIPLPSLYVNKTRPLMTHLTENHKANCQTEKEGRERTSLAYTSSLTLVATSSRCAVADI